MSSCTNVYNVRFDGQYNIVEADSFAECVAVWSAAMQKAQGDDWDGDEQPESVELISDCPVMRAETDMEALAKSHAELVPVITKDGFIRFGNYSICVEAFVDRLFFWNGDDEDAPERAEFYKTNGGVRHAELRKWLTALANAKKVAP